MGLFIGISFSVSEYIKIVLTATVGAYCMMRGVSCFAGGFPNEFITARELSNGVVNAVPWQFYLYLAGIVVVSALGTWWQVRKYKNEDLKHPYHKPYAYRNL